MRSNGQNRMTTTMSERNFQNSAGRKQARIETLHAELAAANMKVDLLLQATPTNSGWGKVIGLQNENDRLRRRIELLNQLPRYATLDDRKKCLFCGYDTMNEDEKPYHAFGCTVEQIEESEQAGVAIG